MGTIGATKTVLLALGVLAVAGCPKSDSGTSTGEASGVDPKASPVVKPKPTGPTHDKLGVCGEDAKDDPFNTTCFLGKPASELPLRCDKPEVFTMCDGEPRYDRWACIGPSKAATSLTFETVRAEPIPEMGSTVPDKVLDGTLKVQAIEYQSKTDKAGGEALVQAWKKRLVKWGCVVHQTEPTLWMRCNGWEANVNYSKYTKLAYLKVALPGVLACWAPPGYED